MLDLIATGQDGASEPLSTQVDKVAVQIVLGAINATERIALLRSVCDQAKEIGNDDVARIISDAVESASRASDAAAADALLSECITHVQQVLCSAAARPICGPSGSGSAPAISPSVPLSEDRELLSDFILESRDHLTQVELQMITLEKDPQETEAINTVFRAFHTIKGLAGFLALDEIREIAHETESLLDLARNHKLIICPATVDVVLASADFLRIALTNLEQRLTGAAASAIPEKSSLLDRIHATSCTVDAPVSPSILERDHTVAPQATETVAGPEWIAPERRSGDDHRSRASDTNCVKVSTSKLDYLVDMAGELVIAESMVRHHPELAQLNSPAVRNSLAQMARITTELQKTAMSMRMVPISSLFQKMNRLVRDLAHKTTKSVELEAAGSETELDRNVVEELADPLMHMVRNAIDHGLETEQERLAAGKSPIGHLRLAAAPRPATSSLRSLMMAAG